jgi:hypothetical protein
MIQYWYNITKIVSMCRKIFPWRLACHRAFDLRDSVRESAAVGIRHCGAADEYSVSETDFLTWVEEAEV